MLASNAVFGILLSKYNTPVDSQPVQPMSTSYKSTIDIYLQNVYTVLVIKTFADHETEKVYHQQFSRKLPSTIQRIALRKLMMINNAGNLSDLRVPPNNRLEPLHGDREGQYSIRINDQYRICFREDHGDYYEVEICDYH